MAEKEQSNKYQGGQSETNKWPTIMQASLVDPKLLQGRGKGKRETTPGDHQDLLSASPPPKSWLKLGRWLRQRNTHTKAHHNRGGTHQHQTQKHKTKQPPRGEGRGVPKGQLTRLLLTQSHVSLAQKTHTSTRLWTRNKTKKRLRSWWGKRQALRTLSSSTS